MDPAGPCFSGKSPAERLSKDDATYLDVTHTNGGYCGYEDSFGAVDYFPNGGSRQPNCPSTAVPTVTELQGNLPLPILCDHNMAWKYFTDSINRVKYYAYKCSGYCSFCKGECVGNDKVVYGEYTVTDNSDYFFGEDNCQLCL